MILFMVIDAYLNQYLTQVYSIYKSCLNQANIEQEPNRAYLPRYIKVKRCFECSC